MKKQPKKPAPKPCECWCILTDGGEILPGWCGDAAKIRDWKSYWKGAWAMKTIRVRIVPVATAKAKRPKPKRRTVDVMKQLERDIREVFGAPAKRRKGGK